MQATTGLSDPPVKNGGESFQLPVALVGSSSRNMSLDIFSVLNDLKLAEPIEPPLKEPHDKSKPKDTEKVKPPNQFKDKESGKTYIVHNRPSVIISITGDAQDLPDDHELNEGINDLLEFFKNDKDKDDKDKELKLSREDATRAILSNFSAKFQCEGGRSKCLETSYRLKLRIESLRTNFSASSQFIKDNFQFPSFRDMILNVTEDKDKAALKTFLSDLKVDKRFNFSVHHHARRGSSVVDAQHKPEPTTGSKRLSKARLVKFFESGVMGAALKVSGADCSAWIVDGGSNGGVMKLAGQARVDLGSAGSRIPLIGVGVAQGEIDSKNHTIKRKNPDIYDSEGHSHLILCVDPDGNCPTKLDQETQKIKPAFGYEIEYTKLFEDSLSRVFNVPIVGLLVGGGPGSLQNVVEAIAGDFPVFVVKGSGRVADLICAIREHESMTYVKNQCEILKIDIERVKKCSAYSKLHVLDLEWDQPSSFVDFVEKHVRQGLKSKQFRSSNLKELFSILNKDNPPLALVRQADDKFATWSLTFGVAQVDDIASGFVRTLEFTSDHQNMSCAKRAEIVVEIMRRMFPLPVAALSSLTAWGEKPDVGSSVSHTLLKLVSPFCIWRMAHDTEKKTFEVHVHIYSEKSGTHPKENGKSEPQKEVKCVFKNAFVQNTVDMVKQAHELQDAISNILHKEYGIMCIALAQMPHHQEVTNAPPSSKASPSSEVDVSSNVKKTILEEKEPSSASASEVKATPVVKKKTIWEEFFSSISTSCLQSTKVLLTIKADVQRGQEFFILEQVLDIIKVYREVAADFFVDLKDELQLRMHGEDADQLCRTTHDMIKRSSPVSLLLYFHKMHPKSQERLIQYLPEFFLRSCPILEPNKQTSFLGLSIQEEGDLDAVQQYEHDFQFPAFSKSSEDYTTKRKAAWTTYFEYLYLNCGDDRPYAPCWDPIALQRHAEHVLQAITSRDDDRLSLQDATSLSQLFDKYREIIVRDICENDMNSVWVEIQKEQGYNTHDAFVLMNRLERAIRKVFYFTFCCKRIVFCSGCMRKFGLSDSGTIEITKDDLKCSNYGADYCEGSLRQGNATNSKDKEKSDSKVRKQVKISKYQKKALKEFCFRWFIKVAFDLKKACAASLLFLRARINAQSDKEKPSVAASSGAINVQKDTQKPSVAASSRAINLSSRDKMGVEKLKDEKVRSHLRSVFFNVVDICGSGKVVLQEKKLEEDILDLIIMAESVNKVVAECDVLKTGCSVYERFPNIGMSLGRKSETTIKLGDYSTKLLTTHLMVAAVEGNAAKASAYISRADLDYISHQFHHDTVSDSRRAGQQCVASCALHMALERGNIDVANVIIDRVCALAYNEEVFAWYSDQKIAKDQFLQTLFLGATAAADLCNLTVSNQIEIPTTFMYLARYSMTTAMDKFIGILRHLKKVDEMNKDIRNFVILPKDSNGLNALHYAVLSQSPKCVSWFIPYMHDFHPCSSTSKWTFVPNLKPRERNPDDSAVKALKQTFNFKAGFSVLLRLHPHVDFSDSDCRLAIAEDWIQCYHYSHSNEGRPALINQKSDKTTPIYDHKEMSPYELALVIWRLLDLEGMRVQDVLHNMSTNLKSDIPNNVDASAKKSEANYEQKKANLELKPVNNRDDSVKSTQNVQSKSSKVHPDEGSNAGTGAGRQSSDEEKKSEEIDDQGSNAVSGAAEISPDEKEKSEENDEEEDADPELEPERLAESFNQRSSAMYKILSNLEAAAEEDVAIDAKKKKGLKHLERYRSHRAISRLVFPGVSYLLYVFFATLMAIIMTNGLFDEPTRFTHAVVEELGWGIPQKKINQIATFSDFTVFWQVLAGFLWGSSPMARSFTTYNLLGPVLIRQTRTARKSCNNNQAACLHSNYRDITFQVDPNASYPTPLFSDFPELKSPFDFFDNQGMAYSLRFTENIVTPQWGNVYYYSGGGYAMTFACRTNETISAACADQPRNGHSTCNCSQRFKDLMPPPSPADNAFNTFLDDSTRALDVSFLVFSPTLQSYVFVHILAEFSETGAVSVWDDYQSFSGRYSKQFDFSERMTTLRISQYVTIIYALMYLVYEWTDWTVLASKIPETLNPAKSEKFKKECNNVKLADPISFLKFLRFCVSFYLQRFLCHWELFVNKSEYYGKIYQLLELIGLACGYSVIVVDLILQSRLRELFKLASAGKFNDPSAIEPTHGMQMHQAISQAHTLLATEREVIGAYMFFTWTRVFAYLVHMPGWGPYLHAIIATIFSGVVLAFVLVVVLLNAAFSIMMYCSYSLAGGDEFQSLQDTFFSMWRMLMGLNEVFGFVENNRGLNGPKLSKGSSGAAFIFLTLLGNLIVMNIIVGLLGEQYQKFGKLSIANFNRELNANLAKDIIAVKSAEGLNPFAISFSWHIPFIQKRLNLNLGITYLNKWKVQVKSDFALKMMLMLEGYYFPDWVLTHWPFQWTRLNSPAALFRLKWFHGVHHGRAAVQPGFGLIFFAGGVAQERRVCEKLIRFFNTSSTPLAIVEAANTETRDLQRGNTQPSVHHQTAQATDHRHKEPKHLASA